MKLPGVTYKHSDIDDQDTFSVTPSRFQDFLRQTNGIVAFKGGLHIRGCCHEPSWHSIDYYISGQPAFWKTYPDLLDIDIPFAQDCLGDQFFFRGEKVFKLNLETGEPTFYDYDFYGFLEATNDNPIEFLGMYPLVQFEMDGKELLPGQLLQAYPPLLLNIPGGIISLEAVPANDQILFLQNLYKQHRSPYPAEEL